MTLTDEDLEAEEPLDGEAHGGVGNTIARFDLNSVNEQGQAGSEKVVVTLVGNTDLCRQRFPLAAGRHVVGRTAESAIFLDHAAVSRQHATLDVSEGKARLFDNGSSNGTLVNGTVVKEVPLRDGDVIMFGRKVRLVVSFGMVPAAPARARALPAASARAAPAPAAPAPAKDEGELQALEDERRQLAILFQLSLRYLAAPAGSDPSEVLFGVLDRIVTYDAAIIAVAEADGPQFLQHPSGVQLSNSACSRVYREADPKAVRIKEGRGDALTLGTLEVRSRASVPLGGGSSLVLLSTQPKLYTKQHDYLSLIGNLYEAASARLRGSRRG
ncbi:MAG: FHA domain-containing protein [Myxococcaceae bacterium]